MAIQDVKWLASNIETDATHRLVTDEQIAKWNNECTTITDWNNATTPGMYVSDKKCNNQPDGNFLGLVAVDNSGNKLVQELTEISTPTSIEMPSKYVRKASRTSSTQEFVFGPWYQYTLDKYVSKDDLAAVILQDFEYVKDTDTGHYILTEWKETLNGEPSNDLVIPDTDEIQIEI